MVLVLAWLVAEPIRPSPGLPECQREGVSRLPGDLWPPAHLSESGLRVSTCPLWLDGLLFTQGGGGAGRMGWLHWGGVWRCSVALPAL